MEGLVNSETARALGPSRTTSARRRVQGGVKQLALALIFISASAGLAAVALPGSPPRPSPSLTISIEVVHNSGALADSPSSIDVDPSGTPWVSFYDPAGQDLVVARKVAGSGCSSASWTCQKVDGGGTCGGPPCDAGRRSSIKVSGDGVVHVAFENSTSGRLAYANNSQGTWTVVPLAAGGQFPSLALGPTGLPVIAYFHSTETDLYLATRVASGGTGCLTSEWNCRKVETAAGATGRFPSVKVDGLGIAHLSHYNQSSGRIRYATQVITAGNCGSGLFRCQDVEMPDPGTAATSIALATTGPRLAYVTNDGTNQRVRVARYSGGGSATCGATADFECSTVYDVGGVGPGSQYAAIEVDDRDFEHIAFYDSALEFLWVAHFDGTSADCPGGAGWHCDPIAGLNLRPTIAIGASGSGTLWVSMDDANGPIGVARTVESIDELGSWTGAGTMMIAGVCAFVFVSSRRTGSSRAFWICGRGPRRWRQ